MELTQNNLQAHFPSVKYIEPTIPFNPESFSINLILLTPSWFKGCSSYHMLYMYTDYIDMANHIF